jgi:Nucleotidyltransferase domain
LCPQRDNVGVPLSPAVPRANPRWAVAERVAEALRQRWPSQLQAIGVHGSLAHGDDTDASDVDLVAITKHPRTGPPAGSRRIDGIIVDLGVISADEYLRHARTLTTSWPLAADQYITTRALHDPDAWLPRLRDTHLAALADTEAHVFATLAREAWCEAMSAQAKARRLAEWYETDAAMLSLSEARLGVAKVDGLLTRTYFRNSADAVRRTGVGSSHIYELGDRLAAQAEVLAERGRPVDADIDDLLGPKS